MTTVTQFAPVAGGPFQFQATLAGPTSNVVSTGSTFNVVVFWNVTGQRWYSNIVDQNGVLIVSRPLIASPPGYPISLTAGSFASTLVFLEASQQFVVEP